MLHPMLPQSASSGSFRFRPPQFSDDVAWLPAWLQPHVAAVPMYGKGDEKDSQNNGGCSVKEVSLSRGNECKDPNGLMVKDTRKEGLRLHLSGDDDSLVSVTPCREKVLLFPLHLSTDGSSGSHDFSMRENSENDRVKSTEQSFEDLQGTGDTKQSNIKSNLGNIKLFSSTCSRIKSAGPSSQTQCNPQDARKESVPKPNSINSEDKEISDAVELSTAASEALVIYELIKSDTSSDSFSSTNILELALQVKQTRLQWLNDLNFSNSNDRISSSDMLSDLDGSDMEDTYGDVGLSLSSSPNICTKVTSVSQVAETPISKQYFGEDGKVGSQHECQETNIYGSGAEKQLEMLKIDLAGDTADAEKENLVMINDCLDSVPSINCGDDMMKHQLHQRNSDEIKSQQEDAFRGSKRRRIMHFRENLIETSYLSESADVAPDLNSCVHRHDGSLKRSQSSIHNEGLCRQGNNGPLLSQDIAKDSVLSLIDPLCSIIPCSISTRTHDCLPDHVYNVEQHNSDKVVMREFVLEAQNMYTTSYPKDEIVDREKRDKPAADSLDLYLNQRHTTSLDVCGMQSPSWQPHHLQNDSNHMQAEQAESAMDAKSVSCKGKTRSVNSLQNGCQQEPNIGAELQISLQNEETPLILCHGGARHRVRAQHPISTEKEMQYPVSESLARFDPSGILQNPHIQHGKFPDTCIPSRKRVSFNDDDIEYQKKGKSPKLTSKYRSRKSSSSGKRKQPSDRQHCWSSQEVKERLTNYDMKDKKKPIFHGLDFLLTGFPCKKEKEVERILRRYGGAVLADIPLPRKKGGKRIRTDSVQLPVVICTKKLQTRKFLYGCAVNAFLLQVDWVADSIEAGSVLPPDKYLILPNQQNRWATTIQRPIHLRTVDRIFCKVGIMLHGDHGFCSKLAEVIKHGQGSVYKSLQGMLQSLKNKNISIGIIIADNESYATRHLRKCASEQRIPVKSTSWIINCIYNGKLLPFEEDNAPSRSTPIKIQAVSASQQWTQEI